MGHSNGIISAPISVNDVQQVLGAASSDVGTLCRHANINMWAKYKPMSAPQVYPLSDEKRKELKWGLDIEINSGLGNLSSGFIKKLYEGNLSWNYVKPSGGAASPYRLSDFVKYDDMSIGYKHDCVNFISGFDDTSVILDSNNEFVLGFDVAVEAGDPYNLSLTDFAFNGVEAVDMYLGLLLVKGSSYMLITSTSKLSGEDLTINVSDAYGLVGTWKMIPFLSSVKYKITDEAAAGTYVSIGITKTKNLTIGAPGSQYVILWDEASYYSGYTSISYAFTLKNENSSSITFTNLKIFLFSTTGTQDPSAGTNEGSKLVSASVEVSGNGKRTFTGTLDLSGYTTSKIYWLGVSADSPVMADNWTQIEDSGDSLE